jgi:hypothetical protein
MYAAISLDEDDALVVEFLRNYSNDGLSEKLARANDGIWRPEPGAVAIDSLDRHETVLHMLRLVVPPGHGCRR